MHEFAWTKYITIVKECTEINKQFLHFPNKFTIINNQTSENIGSYRNLKNNSLSNLNMAERTLSLKYLFPDLKKSSLKSILNSITNGGISLLKSI